MTKMLLNQAHLPVPRGMMCSEVPGRCRLRYPLIVKPAHEDASLGIDADSVVHNLDDLRRRVAWVIQNYHQPAIVEEYIDGRELNVAVIGDQIPQVLPISEITFAGVPEGQPRICSYNVKWMEDSPEFHWVGAECPALLDEQTTLRIHKTALAAFRLLGCRDYARVDMRLARDNQPYIVEVNANPDLSPDAGLTRSALASGRSYTQLVGEITALALRRGESHDDSRLAARRSPAYRADSNSDGPVHADRSGSRARVDRHLPQPA
jgi:D-alanine-D-alanine ligase